MRKISFFGRVFKKNGRVVIETDNKENLTQMVHDAMGGNSHIRVVFYEDEKEREKWMQSYYWAVVIPHIKRGIVDLGNDWDNNKVHDFLKGQYTKDNSTKKLTSNEFNLYIEKCCKFAAELLGVEVPLPTSQEDRFQKLKE